MRRAEVRCRSYLVHLLRCFAPFSVVGRAFARRVARSFLPGGRRVLGRALDQTKRQGPKPWPALPI